MVTTYRKPKFTPDPPPNVEGLPVEQQIKMYFDWVQREVNRVEDWWPNDPSARLDLIESLLGCISEPIVMLDYGYIDFDYTTSVALNCGTTTIISDDDFVSASGISVLNSLVYSPKNSLIVYSFQRLGAQGGEGTIIYLNPSTDVATVLTTSDVISQTIVVSSSGTDLNDRLIYSARGADANRFFVVWTITDSGFTSETITGNVLGGNNAVFPLAETDAYVAFGQSANTNFAVADKATWTFTSIAVPSGWESVDAGQAAQRSANSFLVPLKETSSGDWSFFPQSGTSVIAIGDKLTDCATNITEFVSVGTVVGSKVFWAVNISGTGPNLSYVLVTDTDGTQLALVDSTIAGGAWATGETYYKFTVESNTHIWWFEDSQVFRMNVADYTIEKCTPSTVRAGINWRSSALLLNDYIYLGDGYAADDPPTGDYRVIGKTEAFVT